MENDKSALIDDGENENEILIDGFYDGILPLEKEKDEALAASADLLDEEEWKTAYDVKKFKWDLPVWICGKRC